MSELLRKRRNQTTVRIAAASVPLHICLETLRPIGGGLRNYQENAALKVGEVLFVKDAP